MRGDDHHDDDGAAGHHHDHEHDHHDHRVNLQLRRRDAHEASFTTGIGSGNCGHLDADGNPNFFQLACGGLYFGGAGVGIPVPVTIPDMGTSIASVSCNGTTLTLSGTTPAEAGGNRCSGGTNHHNACTTNAECPGGACKFLRCMNPGCLFGPPLPIPASAPNAAAISTCVINTVQFASGTADCGTGTTTSYSILLSSAVFLTSDLMPMRCSGGSDPGGDCTGGGGCGTVAAGACPGGTCANDTGRCTSASRRLSTRWSTRPTTCSGRAPSLSPAPRSCSDSFHAGARAPVRAPASARPRARSLPPASAAKPARASASRPG